MSRFSNDFRGGFANRVCRHFDKYCEITNPVEFHVVDDVYQKAFKKKAWNAMNLLLESKFGRKCLQRGNTFDLYLPGKAGARKHERTHITFGFPDKKRRPDMEIEFYDLHPDVQEHLNAWVKKAVGLRELRKRLYRRVDDLVDCEWDDWAGTDSRGNRRGGPTPGVGCNTPGQMYRIWPELLPFLSADLRGTVRNASVKSRLPGRISNWGTVDQFLALEEQEEQTVEELAYDRRIFDALTHILVQMSLMMDVPHDDAYPDIHIG